MAIMVTSHSLLLFSGSWFCLKARQHLVFLIQFRWFETGLQTLTSVLLMFFNWFGPNG